MRLITFLIILIIYCSCHNQNSENISLSNNEELIELEIKTDSPNINFESLIESCEFISINDKEIIGKVSNLTSIGDSLFLLSDSKFTQKVFLIDKDGEILNSYKYFGKGPNEALYLQDIDFDTSKDEILILLQSPNKILSFDINLNYLETKNLKTDFQRIFSDSIHYLYSHNEGSILYHLRKLSDEETVFQKFNFEFYGFYPTEVFFKTESNLFFNIPKHPMVYALSNRNLIPRIRINYSEESGSKNKSKNEPTKDFPQYPPTIKNMPQYPPTVKNIFETNNNLIIIYSYKSLIRMIIVSKKTGTIKYQGKLIDKLGLREELFYGNNKFVYGILSADKYLEFYENYILRKKSDLELPKVILHDNMQRITYESNPILVKYYLKDNL